MSHKFQESLKHGQAGEDLFHRMYPELTRLSGRKADFANAAGEGIELKTDSYDMLKSDNFFIERYSDRQKKSPGGPWQAQSKGVAWFIYFFVKNGVLYRFRTDALVAALDEIIPHLKPIPVVNRGWVTEGYKVPREALYDIMEEIALKEAPNV